VLEAARLNDRELNGLIKDTDGACTDANPQQAQIHAPTQQREGRGCVLHDYGAVRMCACQGTEQGDVQRDVTANPDERLITVRTVNYPEWNPGERLIIRKGFWGTDNRLDTERQPLGLQYR
jgi:hypothetical protein